MATYVIGDIHGMYDKFKTCLEAVNFNYENSSNIRRSHWL